MRLLLTMMSPFGRRKEVTMLIGMASMRDFDVVGVEGRGICCDLLISDVCWDGRQVCVA
jgi:hypothetical protein